MKAHLVEPDIVKEDIVEADLVDPDLREPDQVQTLMVQSFQVEADLVEAKRGHQFPCPHFRWYIRLHAHLYARWHARLHARLHAHLQMPWWKEAIGVDEERKKRKHEMCKQWSEMKIEVGGEGEKTRWN